MGEFTEIAHAADDLFDFAVQGIAQAVGESPDTTRDIIRAKAAQERTEAWREEIAEVQEGLFTHLQSSVEGRAGFFAAVGHLCNFITLSIDTDTPEVRKLIGQHPAVTKAVVELYEKYLKLVEDAKLIDLETIDRLHLRRCGRAL